MSDLPDDYEATEADIDMVIEETTGKPVKSAATATGIASMRQRIAQLEAEKAKVLDRLNIAVGDFEKPLKRDLTTINRDLAAARESLAHYESQLGKLN